MHVMSNVWLCISTCFISLAQSVDHPLSLTPILMLLIPLLSGAPLLTSIMNAPFCHRILVPHLVHS